MGYEFFEEKIIFPSAPVPGINNYQSLIAEMRKIISILNFIEEPTRIILFHLFFQIMPPNCQVLLCFFYYKQISNVFSSGQFSVVQL